MVMGNRSDGAYPKPSIICLFSSWEGPVRRGSQKTGEWESWKTRDGDGGGDGGSGSGSGSRYQRTAVTKGQGRRCTLSPALGTRRTHGANYAGGGIEGGKLGVDQLQWEKGFFAIGLVSDEREMMCKDLP